MTREEILAMKPGRELNKAVAETLFGMQGLHLMNEFLPEYSETIPAAWEVLEKPEIMDIYQIGVYPTSFGKWIARPFMPGGRDCTVQAETAPEAICKCVLLAVMDKED